MIKFLLLLPTSFAADLTRSLDFSLIRNPKITFKCRPDPCLKYPCDTHFIRRQKDPKFFLSCFICGWMSTLLFLRYFLQNTLYWVVAVMHLVHYKFRQLKIDFQEISSSSSLSSSFSSSSSSSSPSFRFRLHSSVFFCLLLAFYL